MSFTHDDDAKLCELVSSYPQLYDLSHKDFKDFILKDNIWKEIATSLGKKTDEDCKKRWRSIRDHFKRLKREGKLGTGSAARKPVNWPLIKYVSFLSQVPEERRTLYNLSDIGQNEEISNDSTLEDQDIDVECFDTSNASVQTPPPSDTDASKSKKRKMEKVSDILAENRESRLQLIETLKGASQKQEDEVDAFYKSISLSVKCLPPLLRSEIKMQHLQSLHNIELKYMHSQSQYQQPYFCPQQNIPEHSLVHQTRTQTYQPLDQQENQSCPFQSTSSQPFYENLPY